MTSVQYRGPIWLGLDVHKDSISAGILGAGDATAQVETLGPGEDAVRRLLARVGGPTGAAAGLLRSRADRL
ncbi:MAG: hypothetical protein ACYDAQ_18105 [Mycobacteriales bacterium]